MPAPTPSRSGKARTARAEQKDLRQELAEKLIAQIEAGTASWQKPWVAGEVQLPMNPVTGKPYRGVNREWLLLFSPDQTDPRWCTYKQAEAQGWQVRKDEKGTPIEVWKEYDHKLTEKEKAEKRHAREQIPDPVMRKKALEEIPDTEKRLGARYYSVFHASQIDGIPPLERPEITHEIEGKPDERLPRLVEAMGVEFRTGGNRAFYRSSEDRVQMPPVEAFLTATGHDTTLLHELGHATGHESRLGRKLGNPFGSPEYAKEELRAEMSAAMTAMSLGIGFDPQAQNIEEGANIQQNAAYLASWLKALPEKDRKKELMAAIKDAQGISDYLIQRTPEIEREAEVERLYALSRGETQELDSDLVAHLRAYTQVRQGERTDLPAVGDDWPGGLPTGLGGDRIENAQQFLRNAAEQNPQRAERWAADLRGNPHEYGETVGLEADNIRGIAAQMEQGVERMRNPQVGDLVRFEPHDPGSMKAMPYSGRVIARLDTTGGDFRYHLRAEAGPDQGNEATVYGSDGQFRKIALDQAVGFDRNLASELHHEEVVHSVPDGLRRWMSDSQRLATEEGLRGEEKGFFQEKMQELESIIEQMPSTYQTQDLPDEQKPVGLRYFGPNGAQWFIIEKDRGDPETDGPNGPRQTQAFGLADLGMDYPELGYINIEEITKNPQVELDYHFTPTNLLEIKKEHYPEMVRRISMGESLVKEPPAPTPEELAWQGLRQQTAKMPHKMDMLFEDTRNAAAKLDILDEAGQIELRRQYSKKLDEVFGIIREGPDRGAGRHVLALINAGVPLEGLYQHDMQRYQEVSSQQGERASAFRKELDENLKDQFREYGKEILRVVDSHSEVVPKERQVAAVFWKHGIMASEGNQHVVNFVRDVEEKNLPRLLSVIGHNSDNPASQEAFTRLTRVPLGKTQKERVAQLEKWAGPEVVADMQARQAERSAAKARERLHENLHSTFDHLGSLQVRIKSEAHGPGPDVVVNGKDYLLIKVSQGMDRIVSEKRGAVTQYRLRAEDGTSSGVKSRELTDFAKAVLAVSPDGPGGQQGPGGRHGDVRQAFATVGLPTPDKDLSDFLRERQEIWHGKHPDHQGVSRSVAGAEDFERRIVQDKPAHAQAWVTELQKHPQMYGSIVGLRPDDISAMAQRMEKSLEQDRVQEVPAPTVRQPEMSTSTPVYRAPVRKAKTQGQEL